MVYSSFSPNNLGLRRRNKVQVSDSLEELKDGAGENT